MKEISSHSQQKNAGKKKVLPGKSPLQAVAFSAAGKDENAATTDFSMKYGNFFPSSSGKIQSTPLSGSNAEFQQFISSFGRSRTGKLTAGMIANTLIEADNGFLASQAELYHSVLEKEPVIAAHLQTRILAVAACDWTVSGPDPKRVAELTKILQNMRIEELLRHLLNAFSYGYAGAVLLWEEGGRAIRSFQEILPENFLFDATGNPALRTLSGAIRPLNSYHPNQFILHYHKLKSGSAGSGGLLRPLLWLYFFKHYALRDRARFLEKFGIPFIIARISNEDFENEEVRRNVLASLGKIVSDGSGVVSGDSQIQVLAPSGNPSGEYQAFLEYIDKLYALLILGQTASSSTSSGFSKGQIQENVRRDILEADCRALMSTINSRLLAPLEYFRYGTKNEYSFQLDFSSPENLMEKAQIVKLLSESGLAVSPEWIRNTFNIQLVQELEKDKK
ncbi:MAG: DUF935 family protein [Lentisphaeria bacterium]|nr:DUF935 family protein [Lentisphaeria bacterium]